MVQNLADMGLGGGLGLAGSHEGPGLGYAYEGADACLDHAHPGLRLGRISAITTSTNTPSQAGPM